MAIEIRPITTEERDEFDALVFYVFAQSRSEWERSRNEPPWLKPEETLAAFVDGRIATATGAFPFTVRLNGRAAQAAGVTAVGTYPQYRRQGLLRRTMAEALTRYREAGQSFALLWASFGAIYQRYGYGLASAYVTYEFDPREVAFREEMPTSGAVELMSREEARPFQERIHAEWVAPRNLVVQRSKEWWDQLFRERGDRMRYHAIYRNGAGEARGYLVYDTAEDLGEWGMTVTGPDQSMNLLGFYPLDLEAHRAMWSYIRAHDLVKRVRWQRVPEDDVTPDLLLEPRELHRGTGDAMWMRITDVEAVLPQRPYGDEGTITLAVRDELLPWNDGVYRLETEGDTSKVTRTSGPADLSMRVAALATLVSGYRSATHLQRAGLVEGDAEALRRADRLFATDYRPHMPEGF